MALIDGDRADVPNTSRIFGARSSDTGKPKVQVSRRYCCELGLGTHVRTDEEALAADTLGALDDVDVVFLCVDRHTPRALLNRFA